MAVLQCVTQYPVPPEDVNLNAMAAIREKFGVIVGYSDHTRGHHIPLAAVALGARILEKHISLDFDVPDAQDWKVSCGPEDLPRMVREVREIEAALGRQGQGAPAGREGGRGLGHAKASWRRFPIAAGTTIAADMLTAKRPGSGIPPFELDKVIGRTVAHDISQDAVIKWEDLI